jgi:hypothetical protein
MSVLEIYRRRDMAKRVRKSKPTGKGRSTKQLSIKKEKVSLKKHEVKPFRRKHKHP